MIGFYWSCLRWPTLKESANILSFSVCRLPGEQDPELNRMQQWLHTNDLVHFDHPRALGWWTGRRQRQVPPKTITMQNTKHKTPKKGRRE